MRTDPRAAYRIVRCCGPANFIKRPYDAVVVRGTNSRSGTYNAVRRRSTPNVQRCTLVIFVLVLTIWSTQLLWRVLVAGRPERQRQGRTGGEQIHYTSVERPQLLRKYTGTVCSILGFLLILFLRDPPADIPLGQVIVDTAVRIVLNVVRRRTPALHVH